MIPLKIPVDPVYDSEDQKVGVILKYKDFQKLMERLEDLHDIYIATKAKTKKYKTFSLEQVEAALFGKNEKK